MKWNVSQWKNWQMCPMFSYFHDVRRRGLESTSVALEIGTAFHKFMEAKLKGAPEPQLELSEEAQREWDKLVVFARAWTVPPEWEVRHVERALEWPLGLDILQGRLDALVWWNDGYWSLQWKTCSQTANLELLGDSVMVGFHECAYHWLAEQAGYLPFKGTILITAKKLTQKAITEGRNPIAPPVYLTRSKAMVAERITQMREGVHKMVVVVDPPAFLQWDTTKYITKNTDSCMGKFGNSRCQYWQVCHEGGSIDALPFVDLKNRYEEVQDGV
jgi:hypothetical protein